MPFSKLSWVRAPSDGPPPLSSSRSSRSRPKSLGCGICFCPRTTSRRVPASVIWSTD
ncbi:hypothetical protein EMPG_15370 [Blastomyces silverae]|uniref:Uncharacterized protein n=1 Tax=Blastomyces silverae TaxID=2060906 RepID=A0A0H1BDS7_9EURO|nr:hypothetical protein EMPG_15370 [Blastomyces silverae]